MLIHGGNFEAGVVDFSVNTNPCVTEERIRVLLVKHANKALVYPEIDGNSLLQLISDRTDIDPTRLVVGNGAIDCLYRVASTLKPQTALIIEPTFSEYQQGLQLAGCNVHPLTYDLQASQEGAESVLLNQISRIKAEMVVLCNPNNPTGHCYSRTFIKELIQMQRVHKGYVLVDESFRFFENLESCYDRDAWNLIVLTSLTKYYGIPGLRIGYLSSNFTLIDAMKKSQMPWNINGVALAVTKDLLVDEGLKVETARWYEDEKDYLESALSELDGLEVQCGHTNYLLCKLTSHKGSQLNQWLLKRPQPLGIRECSSFNGLGDDYIRIGLKDHKSNLLLMEALTEYWRQADE